MNGLQVPGGGSPVRSLDIRRRKGKFWIFLNYTGDSSYKLPGGGGESDRKNEGVLPLKKVSNRG